MWNHRLNEVLVEGIHRKLRNLPSGQVSTWRIMLQRYVVLPARCQADLIAVPVTCHDTLADIPYADVFSKGEDDLGCTDFVQHRIDTGKQRSFCQKLRRHPDKYVEAIDEHVKTFLRQCLIRPSRSEWRSNVVMVKKSDGSLRFCGDYRQLNLATIKNCYTFRGSMRASTPWVEPGGSVLLI